VVGSVWSRGNEKEPNVQKTWWVDCPMVWGNAVLVVDDDDGKELSC
jgi:hypoxanthine phosphoribosyltransferase